jgi:trimeric autotransporter adhesin
VLTNSTYFYQSMLKKLTANTEYTMSGWYWTENIVKGTTNYTIMNCYADGYYNKDGTSRWFGVKSSNMNINTGGWIYFTNTFTTPTSDIWDNATNFHVTFYMRDFTGDVYIRDLKLEKGNKATDWTPAPEDTQSDIDDVKQIADTANSNASSAKETAESALSAAQTLEDTIEELTTKIITLEEWKSKVLTGTQKVLIETN